MPDKELTEEEQLSLSAQDAHNLIEMCQTNGWKFLKEFYFDTRIKQCKDYLYNDKNTDPVMIRAKVMLLDFMETMLDEITMQVQIGLEAEKELVKRKEKKKKK
jgi:hypothetical protein